MSTVPHDEDGVVLESEAIVVSGGSGVTLFDTSDPNDVLEKATKVATSLKGVLVKAGLITNIQGKEFPQVEAWTTLGGMLGVFAVATEQYKIPEDEGGGYRVYVEARKNGVVIGGAWGECSKTERAWGKRDNYALLGMAETRATSRAMRKPLGWVMKLAGVEATAAEEVPPGGFEQKDRSQAQGRAAPETRATQAQKDAQGRPVLKDGAQYQMCPQCGKEAVVVGPEGQAVCRQRAGGCEQQWVPKVWAIVSVPGPWSIDPASTPARHEAPADIQDLTDNESLPF